jgi:hypothetical protein
MATLSWWVSRPLMEEGSAVCADNMGRLPGENDDAMDTETFMMAGFMILPMLFVLFGLMQRMNQRRRYGRAPHSSTQPLLDCGLHCSPDIPSEGAAWSREKFHTAIAPDNSDRASRIGFMEP